MSYTYVVTKIAALKAQVKIVSWICQEDEWTGGVPVGKWVETEKAQLSTLFMEANRKL